MKRWAKVAVGSLIGLMVVGGAVAGGQRRALSNGRLEIHQHGASGFEKALSSLKLADRLGNAEAAFEIGKCYSEGVVTPVDHETAMVWFQRAADRSHPEAMAIIGQAMVEGGSSPDDLVKGAQFLRRSAEAESPLGMFNFGRALNNGKGVVQDNQLGNSWIDRAAEAGNVDAAFTQGGIYVLTGSNANKGVHFLEIAANRGHDAANMLLFNAYIGALGAAPDPVKALALLKKGAGEGNAWAILKLAMAFGRPELGLQKDLNEAERLVRLAAEKGSLEARKLVAAMDAPKDDPIRLVGPEVITDNGGYARVQGLVKNTSSRDLDALVQFDLVSPNGVTLENFSKTLRGIPPGGSQMIDIAIAPYHRNAHVQVRGVKWR